MADRYTKKQLEEARRLFGIETEGQLDEALCNVRQFFSILQECNDEDEAAEPTQDPRKERK